MTTDEGNSQNEIWHWRNDWIGVAGKVGSKCEVSAWSDSSVGYSSVGCGLRSQKCQLYIATSKNHLVVGTIYNDL